LWVKIRPSTGTLKKVLDHLVGMIFIAFIFGLTT